MTAPRWLLPAVLLAAAALFVVGVAAERRSSGEGAEHRETAEHAEGAEHGESGEHPETGKAGERSERVAGVDLESTPLVAAAVVASLALAALAWRRPRRRALVAIAVVAAGFALLDGGEVVHQRAEGRAGLAALAAAIAGLHVLASVLAGAAPVRTGGTAPAGTGPPTP